MTENEKGNIHIKCGKCRKEAYKSDKGRVPERAEHKERITKSIDNQLKTETTGIIVLKEESLTINNY